MNSTDFLEYLAPCCKLARAAGDIILRYPASKYPPELKTDPRTGRRSEVTPADIEANRCIVGELQKLTPNLPSIAEENPINNAVQSGPFWLVDGLDGTKAFVKGKDDYTVNIALINDGRPVLGVIYSPAQELLYYGSKGQGAFRVKEGGVAKRINVQSPGADGHIVVKSESHPSRRMQAYLDTLAIKDIQPSSSSLKFCKVAEGAAHIYPRLGMTMEWDTAAGQAILEAAGGQVRTEDGSPLLYGKAHFENPEFIASHGPVLRRTVI